MAYRWETMETVTDFIFLGSKIIADGDCSLIKRCLLLERKAMANLDSTLKRRDITCTTNVCLVKAMIFCISNIWMWEMEHNEGWAPKNWCFWTVVLEKTLENPMDCEEIQPIHPKGDQSWIFIGRTDDEVKLHLWWWSEAPILQPPDATSWLIGKDPDAGKDWRQEEKGTTEDMVVDGITNLMDVSLSKLRELVMNRKVCHAAVHGVSRSWTWSSDWAKLNYEWSDAGGKRGPGFPVKRKPFISQK